MNKNYLILSLTIALGACGCDPSPNTNPMMMDGSVVQMDSSMDVDAGIDSGVVVVVPVCGDGMLQGTEGCDDGNLVTEACTYGQTSCTVCDANCNSVAGAVTFCGDGAVNGTEECDDSNTNNDDNCNNDCVINYPVGATHICRFELNRPCDPGMEFLGYTPHSDYISQIFPKIDGSCNTWWEFGVWPLAGYQGPTPTDVVDGDFVRRCKDTDVIVEMTLCYSMYNATTPATYNYCRQIP